MKILVADDHATIRQLVRKILQDEYPCGLIEEVMNGLELVTKVVSEKWDIVISDISMPVMNGLDAVKEIRKHSLTLPVLILSSHTEDIYVRYAMKAGASGYVHKYRMYEELNDAVRKALGSTWL